MAASSSSTISLRPAEARDVGVILGFIRELAEYERLSHEVVATEAMLQRYLFGESPLSASHDSHN